MLLTEPVPRWRGIFCNRTLNLRAIRAIGYDMDYTLVHYHVGRWERRAFEHVHAKLLEDGWPVEDTVFDPDAVIRGLVVDLELGNIVKSNQFGYVKAASHGTRTLGFDEWRAAYARIPVDLSEPRFQFLNTLFSVSEGCMYAQLVDLLDAGRLDAGMSYADLWQRVRRRVDETHMEGRLKAEILDDPEHFVDLDAEMPLALLDQKTAGKKLLLITNSEWSYTRSLMELAVDPFLPGGMKWRDLFDLVIIGARKPAFFTDPLPALEVATDDGLLRPVVGKLQDGRQYYGANAGLVEEYLGLDGEQILYVGDHVYGDVHVSKRIRRWRTALVLRELEDDLRASEAFGESEQRLAELMRAKESQEQTEARLRMLLQRHRRGSGPLEGTTTAQVEEALAASRADAARLDALAAPLARAASELASPRWGLLMRTGSDKSHMARHVERHADVFTSRVSNLLFATPYGYLRSSRALMAHDRDQGQPARSAGPTPQRFC